MNKEQTYEKPKVEFISFRLEENLMSGPTVEFISNPTGVPGGGPWSPPDSNDDLHDKSSYQIP